MIYFKYQITIKRQKLYRARRVHNTIPRDNWYHEWILNILYFMMKNVLISRSTLHLFLRQTLERKIEFYQPREYVDSVQAAEQKTIYLRGFLCLCYYCSFPNLACCINKYFRTKSLNWNDLFIIFYLILFQKEDNLKLLCFFRAPNL